MENKQPNNDPKEPEITVQPTASEPQKGIKEKFYDQIKVPLPVLDAIIVVLIIAVIALIVMGMQA